VSQDDALAGLLSSFSSSVGRLATSSEETSARRIREAAENIVEALRGTLAVTTTGSDLSGYVTAEVTSDGALHRLTISAYAMRDLDATALGVACREAILAARTGASEALMQRLRGDFGATFDRPSRADLMAQLRAAVGR
jgi:hypothetical protein